MYILESTFHVGDMVKVDIDSAKGRCEILKRSVRTSFGEASGWCYLVRDEKGQEFWCDESLLS